MHNKLIRSSLLAAVGTVFPASVVGAQTVLYSDQGLFEADAAGLGNAQLYVETFEENTIGGAYGILTPPLSSGVPNNGFPTGLDAPDLSIDSYFGGSLVAVLPNASYWPHIVSTVVGTNSSFDHTIMNFGGDGVRAVGFDVWGIQTFLTNFPEEVNYWLYDTGGALITSGVFATPTSDSGAFMGVISATAIGAIEIDGLRFGLNQQEFVDNIQAWNPVLPLDIKPGSCPNPLNRGSRGLLPMAVLGTMDYDVAMIDESSLRLARVDGVGGEVEPHSAVYEDVATPFDGEPCDCHDMGGDGIMDLLLMFRTPDVVDALELDGMSHGDVVELVVTGTLLDGTAFEAYDCIKTVGRNMGWWATAPATSPRASNKSLSGNSSD
jgi:hypothetical protein